MSLWSVPSKETVDLMTSFYTLLSEGKGKAEALRQAKLELMKKRPNPFFWGGLHDDRFAIVRSGKQVW